MFTSCVKSDALMIAFYGQPISVFLCYKTFDYGVELNIRKNTYCDTYSRKHNTALW